MIEKHQPVLQNHNNSSTDSLKSHKLPFQAKDKSNSIASLQDNDFDG